MGKFENPKYKKYNTEILTDENLQEALATFRELQVNLWESLPAAEYANAEKTLDVAIASMMAHLLRLPVRTGPEEGRK